MSVTMTDMDNDVDGKHGDDKIPMTFQITSLWIYSKTPSRNIPLHTGDSRCQRLKSCREWCHLSRGSSNACDALCKARMYSGRSLKSFSGQSCTKFWSPWRLFMMIDRSNSYSIKRSAKLACNADLQLKETAPVYLSYFSARFYVTYEYRGHRLCTAVAGVILAYVILWRFHKLRASTHYFIWEGIEVEAHTVERRAGFAYQHRIKICCRVMQVELHHKAELFCVAIWSCHSEAMSSRRSLKLRVTRSL